jgi:glycosyltransferase involved in cell wall biosynthesis
MRDTILFLQSEIHNYHISLIIELTECHNYDVISIYKDKNIRTPFVPPKLNNVTFIGKSNFKTANNIIHYINGRNVEMARVSGWVDKEYLKVAKYLKNIDVKTVVCSDTQWKNEIKQTIGAFLYNCKIRSAFTHIMVAGPYQFEYARKLNFDKRQIIFGNLSANSDVFNTTIEELNKEINRRILFVGLLDKNKIGMLLEVWYELDDKNGWNLDLIGNGPLKKDESTDKSVSYLGYKSNIEIAELMKISGFMILPSLREQWGVVMHEAALSGLPILCSDTVGAIPLFMINGFNGFTFKMDDKKDLKKKIKEMMSLSDDQLYKMKVNSILLGSRITTPISAASLISVLK